MTPQVRDPKIREKTAKLEKFPNELVGIGGRPKNPYGSILPP
jgi:hypothetical protein